MKKVLFTLWVAGATPLFAQNLFEVKLDNCSTTRFCLDCGDTPAGFDSAAFAKLQEKLNKSLNLSGVQGAIRFQVLVDANGRACVLSHNDRSEHWITRKIITELNKFKGWTPAITGGKTEEKTSINLLFLIANGRLTGQVERVNMEVFESSFDTPLAPEVSNTQFVYSNENKDKYTFSPWTMKNSNLIQNMNNEITVDTAGLVWLTMERGLVTFAENGFTKIDQPLATNGKLLSYFALEADNSNVVWAFAADGVYSFRDQKWVKHGVDETGIDGGYNIVNQARTGEVFFCSDEGLTIYKEGSWKLINQALYPELPSNRVYYAWRDAKNRIWISTFSGVAMIDENNQLVNFEKTNSALTGLSISSVDEDEHGNLYFSVFSIASEGEKKTRKKGGVVVRAADGTFQHFTTENSGIPNDDISSVLYDRVEKILWISTYRAGIVRFDLQGGWENYHSENSEIPTSAVQDMAVDKRGNLYLATKLGLVRIQRR